MMKDERKKDDEAGKKERKKERKKVREEGERGGSKRGLPFSLSFGRRRASIAISIYICISSRCCCVGVLDYSYYANYTLVKVFSLF